MDALFQVANHAHTQGGGSPKIKEVNPYNFSNLVTAAEAENFVPEYGLSTSVFNTCLLNPQLLESKITETITEIEKVNIKIPVQKGPNTSHLFTQIVQEADLLKYTKTPEDINYVTYLLQEKHHIRLNTTLNSLYMASLHQEIYPLFSFIKTINDIARFANAYINTNLQSGIIDSSSFHSLHTLKESPLLLVIDKLLRDICYHCTSYNLFLLKRRSTDGFSVWNAPELKSLDNSIFYSLKDINGLRITRNIVRTVVGNKLSKNSTKDSIGNKKWSRNDITSD